MGRADQATEQLAKWARIYFDQQSTTGRHWLRKRADRGETVTIPTTQHGDIVMTGADFLKAIDNG